MRIQHNGSFSHTLDDCFTRYRYDIQQAEDEKTHRERQTRDEKSERSKVQVGKWTKARDHQDISHPWCQHGNEQANPLRKIEMGKTSNRQDEGAEDERAEKQQGI